MAGAERHTRAKASPTRQADMPAPYFSATRAYASPIGSRGSIRVPAASNNTARLASSAIRARPLRRCDERRRQIPRGGSPGLGLDDRSTEPGLREPRLDLGAFEPEPRDSELLAHP